MNTIYLSARIVEVKDGGTRDTFLKFRALKSHALKSHGLAIHVDLEKNTAYHAY